MKKLFVFFISAVILIFGFYYFKDTVKQILSQPKIEGAQTQAVARPILRIGLVADSENDNGDLQKALNQLQGYGVNFVLGLGDWSDVGTLDELIHVKTIFDNSKLTYFLTPGEHDLWDSRNRGEAALTNFKKVFGEPSRVIDENGVRIVLLDNSDIYTGISSGDWTMLGNALGVGAKRTFVFAHETPFHPESQHIMGEGNAEIAKQATSFLELLQNKKVDGFFSGDLHFFAQYHSPDASVKITTIGAVDNDRNFQGPRFSVLTVWNDYKWDVEDVEIR